MVIWKYELKPANVQILNLPYGAKILQVHNQRGVICIWAEVNPHSYPVSRTFYVAGTGTLIDMSRTIYIGTVIIDPCVWHVYVAVDG